MDATSAYRTYTNLYDNLNGNVQGLRIGVPKEYFGEGIDAEVKTAVHAAIQLLEQNGATVKEISLPAQNMRSILTTSLLLLKLLPIWQDLTV